MSKSQGRVTAWLERSPGAAFVAYAAAAGFSTYFCMYAFRKPFAAAAFEGTRVGQLELKTALVISQLIGYTLSKYVGIKICSEIRPARRAFALVSLVLVAEAALVLFAVVPAPLKIVAMFANGLPLGMVWGMVVGYLEGRRTSDILLSTLSCSFILASAATKDVGRWMIDGLSVSQWWMPAATGLCFLPLFLLSVWLLNQLPQPDSLDIAERVERRPMLRADRWRFIQEFLPGLAMLIVVYLLLTAFRDFRDNYGLEIFRELGYTELGGIFSMSDLPVTLGVVFTLWLIYLVKDNRWGLFFIYVIMLCGALLLGGSTLLLDAGQIGGLTWMILVGLGSYMIYVPYNSVLFDRLIASTRVMGTAVFAIYLADAIGYTASMGTQLFKDMGQGDLSRLAFFRNLTYITSVSALVLLAASYLYFAARVRQSEQELASLSEAEPEVAVP